VSFRFQFRRGTTAERDAANPVLAAGEPAVVLDSGQPAELVLGDGVTAMADLRRAVWGDDTRLALAVTATQPGDLGTALDAKATRRLALAASPITNPTVTVRGSTPLPVDTFAGAVWGWNAGSIYRSTDDGDTWALYCAAPDSDPAYRLIPTSDGEVIYGGPSGVWKSTGWATGSPTWGTAKATPNGTSQFLQFQIDGDGTKFIVAEYSSTSRADSRYAYISTNAGTTFTQVYDSVARYGATLANGSHIHGACYDPWTDRFYLAEGHDDGGTVGAIAGIYYSEDNGATWTRPPGLIQNPPPTVIVATDDGLVCGSDSAQAGVWGVLRRDDPDDEALARTWAWRTGRGGVVGFGACGFREPVTGTVYIGFRTEYTDVAPVIAGGTAATAALVYAGPLPATAADDISSIVVPSADRLLAYARFGGVGNLITATLPGPGARSVDTGGYGGGTATDGTSVAAGARSSTGAGIRAVAVGVDASATQQDSVAVGHNAAATADSMTMIGSGTDGVAQGTSVGYNASTPAAGNVAVGYNAATTQASSTAIGHASAATGLASTALGKGGTASGTRAVTVGANTTASGERSVALGEGVTTSTWYQVAIGQRHIELEEMAAAQLPVSAPATNKARLYVKDNGSGKTQLCIRFASGAEIVIVTEA